MQIRKMKMFKQIPNIIGLNNIVSQARRIKQTRYINESYYKISTAIQRPYSDIVELARDGNIDRFRFLESMRNHLIRPQNIVPENDSEYILEIYKEVEKPTAYHFDIVRKTNDSFENISKIFDLAQDEMSLEFVRNMQYEVLDGSPEAVKLILDMLNSPYKDKYIENPENYSSYLKLNIKNKKAIKALDKLLSEDKYDRTKYDNKLSTINLMKNRSLATVLEGKDSEIENGYTKEKASLIKLLVKNFVRDKKTPNADIQKDLLDIYKSSGTQNLDLRTSVIRQFRYDTKSEEGVDLKNLLELFRRIDADENISNFVRKVISRGLEIHSIGELNRIIDITPLTKATVFFNNFKRIVATSAGEERINALQNELENPFFTPSHKTNRACLYKSSYDYGFISKMLKIAENEIDKFRYRRMLNTREFQPKIEAVSTPDLKIKFARPKLKAGYKIQLSNEINDLVKNILGAKTYEKQLGIYTENVTKIRLRLLPEIFQAIKTEASEARKLGKPVSIKNSNAVALYRRINGRNRKLIRYMLKQTNEDGYKTFRFRDITNLIDKTEAEIVNLRKANPDFKYADTKVVYANLYDDFIKEYGKLRKRPKRKTN